MHLKINPIQLSDYIQSINATKEGEEDEEEGDSEDSSESEDDEFAEEEMDENEHDQTSVEKINEKKQPKMKTFINNTAVSNKHNLNG